MTINTNKLKQDLERNPDPFNFHLYLTLANNGKIDNQNPFKNDKTFISRLIRHYESLEQYDLCVDFLKLLKSL